MFRIPAERPYHCRPIYGQPIDAPCFDGIVCVGHPMPHIHAIIPVLLQETAPLMGPSWDGCGNRSANYQPFIWPRHNLSFGRGITFHLAEA